MGAKLAMIYAALFGWSWFAALVADNVRELRRAAGLTIALLALLFVGLRGYSTDYDGYVDLYEVMRTIDMDYPQRLMLAKDVFLSLMIDGLIAIGAGPQWMFLILAALAVGLKHHVYRRVFGDHTAVAWMVTLCLYFFLHEHTQSRVAVALPMCTLGLFAALEGRKAAWIGWILLGAGWHLSALLLIPLTGVFLLPRRMWNTAFTMALLGECLIGILAFDVFAANELRLASLRDITGASATSLVIAGLRLTILLLLAREALRRPLSAEWLRLVQPCTLLVCGAPVMLVAFQGISTIFAFRLYDLLDCYSILIVTGALLQRRPVPVLLALSLCGVGIVQQYLPDLFKPYMLAPLSSYVLR